MLTQKKLVADKLCKLSSFLHHASEEFDNVAKYIREKKIKMSIRSVALKTRQYEQELDSQLSMLRVRCVLRNDNDERRSRYPANKNISDKKIIERCCSSEVFFSKAYKSILNEYFPFKPLRDMLRYQLTGIQTDFRQLKLLHSVMPAQINTAALVI